MKTLRKLKPKERLFENDFFVFDTETTPFELNKTCKLIFGVIYGYGYQKVLYTEQEFIDEFKNPMYLKKKVFAHNAEFDLNVIYGNIYELDKSAIFNGRFIGATNEVCYFADSMNIFPTSVKQIGDMIGKPKLELSKEFWNKGDITENDITYCIRDCEIIFDALLHMFNKVGNIKITLAGLSLDLFRRQYLGMNIDYNDTLCNKFFNSYYGGRCEAFYIGDCKATVYDINSMYPYAMFEEKFPNPKYLQSRKFIRPDIFENKYLKNYEGVAHVTVNHLPSTFGYLPYKFCGKLLFPVGRFTGWFNFNELRFAIEEQAIKIEIVHEIVYSKPIESPFKNYVTEMYKLRFESQLEFDSYLYKIFANSLYGKFAQRILSEQMYIKSMTDQYEEIQQIRLSGKLMKLTLFNEIRDDCFLEISTGQQKFLTNTIPLFSSYITSYARVHLLKKLIQYKKFYPLYCDTDSIFFAKDPKIPNSKLLGEFKKELKIITHIAGLKNYEYISDEIKHTKIKGVPKSATKENEVFTYYNLVKTKESLRRNLDAGTQIKRTKTLKNTYDKRIVHTDGTTAAIDVTGKSE
jgi:hypothetical protein